MGHDIIRGNMALMVLSVLSDGPSYGYQITKALKARVGEGLALSTGTLYVTLQRLESQNLIRSYWEKQANGRNRHYFEILPEGRTQLEATVSRWMNRNQALDAVIRGAGGAS